MAVAYTYDYAGNMTGQTRYSNLDETDVVAATTYTYDNAEQTVPDIHFSQFQTVPDSPRHPLFAVLDIHFSQFQQFQTSTFRSSSSSGHPLLSSRYPPFTHVTTVPDIHFSHT